MNEPLDLESDSRAERTLRRPGPWQYEWYNLTRDEMKKMCSNIIDASPSPYFHGVGSSLSIRDAVALVGNGATSQENAEYIAALSPDVALALIAEIESLRAMLSLLHTEETK